MADDRGGAWKRLSADSRLRVGVFRSGQDVHHGSGTIRLLMAPPQRWGRGPSASGWRKRGQLTGSNVRGNESTCDRAGRIRLKVTNVATSPIMVGSERMPHRGRRTTRDGFPLPPVAGRASRLLSRLPGPLVGLHLQHAPSPGASNRRCGSATAATRSVSHRFNALQSGSFTRCQDALWPHRDRKGIGRRWSRRCGGRGRTKAKVELKRRGRHTWLNRSGIHVVCPTMMSTGGIS